MLSDNSDLNQKSLDTVGRIATFLVSGGRCKSSIEVSEKKDRYPVLFLERSPEFKPQYFSRIKCWPSRIQYSGPTLNSS